jgi:RNA polymerase sigma factor (sigma-70 family)
MNDGDFALLRRFLHEGDESAFSDVVRLHLDIVFATALRKVGETGAAQEVAQNVFAALARKAWQFSPEDSLPAWLHRTALLESKHWLRGELRRRRREQTAAELGTTMKTPDEEPAIRALLPLLDEALLSVSEKDRTALLLRFYERRSLRELGGALGVSETTAQKRVATALDRVAAFFQRRGFRTAGAGVTVAALQRAATAAPAAVTQGVIQAVLHSAPPAATALTALLARIVALPKAQTVAVCVVLALAPATVEWSRANAAGRRSAQIQVAIEAARAESDAMAAESDRLKIKLAALENASGTASVPGFTLEQKEAAARNFALLKTRLAGLGAAGPYVWADDLPFVRVPKSALKNVSSDVPAFGPNGRIAPWTREVLNLPDPQVTQLEAQLGDHLGAMDRLAASRAAVTNWVDSTGTYHNHITLPPLGPDGQSLEDALATNLVNMLGPQEAKLVLSPFSSANQWLSSEKVSHYLINEPGEFELTVKLNDSAAPSISTMWQGHLGMGGPIDADRLPPFLAEQFIPWLERNGLTNGVFRTFPQ